MTVGLRWFFFVIKCQLILGMTIVDGQYRICLWQTCLYKNTSNTVSANVPKHVPNGISVIVEPNDLESVTEGIVTLPCVARVNNGVIQIPVLNQTDRTVHLTSHLQVGSVFSVKKFNHRFLY